MDTPQENEVAVARLPKQDRARLRAWLHEHATEAWDRQLEHDVAADRLAELGDQVMADSRSRRAARSMEGGR